VGGTLLIKNSPNGELFGEEFSGEELSETFKKLPPGGKFSGISRRRIYWPVKYCPTKKYSGEELSNEELSGNQLLLLKLQFEILQVFHQNQRIRNSYFTPNLYGIHLKINIFNKNQQKS
jgi:hypothetical protein